MIKATVRTERWLEKYNEPNPLKRQSVKAQVAYEFELQEKIDTAIKTILSEYPIPTILNILYLNFGRKIYALARRYTNKQLQTEIDFVMQKAISQQLDKEILNKILDAMLKMKGSAEK